MAAFDKVCILTANIAGYCVLVLIHNTQLVCCSERKLSSVRVLIVKSRAWFCMLEMMTSCYSYGSEFLLATCCRLVNNVQYIDRWQAWTCPSIPPNIALSHGGTWAPIASPLFSWPSQVHIPFLQGSL